MIQAAGPVRPLQFLKSEFQSYSTERMSGRVLAVNGPLIRAHFPGAGLGDICSIGSLPKIFAQVVAFNESTVFLAPFSEIRGLSAGTRVEKEPLVVQASLPDKNPGLVIDSLGIPLRRNSSDSATGSHELDLFAPAPEALRRTPIKEQLITGVRSIDVLCGIGYGQRIGLFAAPGLGKSTLLGMLARNAAVDICVIALVGERGREVPEFLEHLGPSGLARSVVVAATSDQPPLKRSLCAATATAVAEHYRSRGKKVLLLVDSLTRTARAIRDVSLAAGEMPIRQGLTSSVYSELPRLIERSGNDSRGSITAIYSLLDTSEYELDPLAEEAKSLLDGHISLDSHVAANGVRPAIDFTRSISRCAQNFCDQRMTEDKTFLLRLMKRLKSDKNIALIGGEPDSELSAAIKHEADIQSFLNQGKNDIVDYKSGHEDFTALLNRIRATLEALECRESSSKPHS